MPSKPVKKPSRRQFIRRTVQGASLFGLGSAFGLASPVRAAKVLGVGSPKSGRPLGKEFTYDISALAKVDPGLIHFEESAAIPTGFKEVRGIALGGDDRICVAGDQSIRVFSKEGVLEREFEAGGAPRCLAVAQTGLIYVGLTKSVRVFENSAKVRTQWESLGANAVITSIAVGAEDVFVADAGNRVVLRYDMAGKIKGSIGKRDPAKNVPGLVVPSPFLDLTIGTDGLLWVANPGRHQIEAYTFNGDLEASWGKPGQGIDSFCGCCNPIHFAFLADGRIVTSEKGLARVKIFSDKGQLESVVAAPASFAKQMENPNVINRVCMELAVDSNGRILLADSMTREIRIFTRKQESRA